MQVGPKNLRVLVDEGGRELVRAVMSGLLPLTSKLEEEGLSQGMWWPLKLRDESQFTNKM